jgi:hypothetical protein
VLSSLSTAEREVLAESTDPLEIPVIVKHTPSSASLSTTTSKLSKVSSLASDEWTEVDGSNASSAPDGVEAISGSDEDEECNSLPITIEDFEAGKVRQRGESAEDGAKGQLTGNAVRSPELVTLASYSLITHDDTIDEDNVKRIEREQSRLRRSTSPSPRTASFKPITPRRTASMLMSISKTIRGKLSYATGETRMIRQSSAPAIDTLARANESATNSPRKVRVGPVEVS